MKLSIIIPCFNEEKTIIPLLKKVINNAYSNKEIIVIDDRSVDNTNNLIVKEFGNNKDFKILRHEKNKGKGACINSGLKVASGDIVLIQDADLEYDPSEHIKMIKPILDNKADVVYGSRFSGGQPVRAMFYWHRLGNFLLTNLSNMFTNLNLTDMETGFKAIRKNLFNDIKIKERRFGFEPEITIKLAKKKCRFFEIGVSYNGRSYEEGKKITWKDGFIAVYCILRYSIFD